MHLVGLVLALVGGAAVWYWRLQVLRDAGGEALDVVGRLRGARRMKAFRRKAEASPFSSVDDPVTAAAVLLFVLADEAPGGLHSAEQEIARVIGTIAPSEDRDEILSYARWAARHAVDPLDVVRRFKPLWRERLNAAEREQLVAMADAVISASGDRPTFNQTQARDILASAIANGQTR